MPIPKIIVIPAGTVLDERKLPDILLFLTLSQKVLFTLNDCGSIILESINDSEPPMESTLSN